MTIHKSQGSEFDQVNVILPDKGSAAPSRELLYTAVTRARTGVRIYAARESIELAIRQRIDRSSGLGELLWRERNAQG
jgi:exodeoxyribonuclease V alpha subunit